MQLGNESLFNRAAPALARNEVGRETSTVPSRRHYDDERRGVPRYFGPLILRTHVIMLPRIAHWETRLEAGHLTRTACPDLRAYSPVHWCCMDDTNLTLCRRPRYQHIFPQTNRCSSSNPGCASRNCRNASPPPNGVPAVSLSILCA